MDYRAEARRTLDLIKTHDAETALSLAIKHWHESAYAAGRASVQGDAVQVQVARVTHADATPPQPTTTLVPEGTISKEAQEAMRLRPDLPWKLPGAGGTINDIVGAQMAAGPRSVVQDNAGAAPVGDNGEPAGLIASAVGAGMGGAPLVPGVGGGPNPTGDGLKGNAAIPDTGGMEDVNRETSAAQPGFPPGLPISKQGTY